MSSFAIANLKAAFFKRYFPSLVKTIKNNLNFIFATVTLVLGKLLGFSK